MLSVRSVVVYPAPDRRSARVTVSLQNASSLARQATVSGRLFKEPGDFSLVETQAEVRIEPGAMDTGMTLKLTDPAEAWDEFSPARYRVEIQFGDGSAEPDQATARFGFRQIDHVGKVLRIDCPGSCEARSNAASSPGPVIRR